MGASQKVAIEINAHFIDTRGTCSIFGFDAEMVWAQLGLSNIVYLFTRYAAVVERVFFLLEILLWNSTDEVRSSLACSDCH